MPLPVPGPDSDILAAFRFSVVFLLGGVTPVPTEIRFQRVSGLAAEIQTTTLVEGGQNLHAHRLPERVDYGNLVLERGRLLLSQIDAVHRVAFSLFDFAPSNVIVTLHGEAGEPLAAWLFLKAYPVRWATSDLDANATEVVIDTLELAYSRMQQLQV
jgi:phage tail-like protein